MADKVVGTEKVVAKAKAEREKAKNTSSVEVIIPSNPGGGSSPKANEVDLSFTRRISESSAILSILPGLLLFRSQGGLLLSRLLQLCLSLGLIAMRRTGDKLGP